jgi:hypothetical protein
VELPELRRQARDLIDAPTPTFRQRMHRPAIPHWSRFA